MDTESNRQLKKAQTTISWTNEKLEACLQEVKVSKYHVGKGQAARYEFVASILNSSKKLLKGSALTGLNLKSKVENAMINYEGKFFTMEANKSGFEGDMDVESNYTSIEFLAKSLLEDVKKEEDAKVDCRGFLPRQFCQIKEPRSYHIKRKMGRRKKNFYCSRGDGRANDANGGKKNQVGRR